jgi:rSAM/selenodomain-associated transferase 1
MAHAMQQALYTYQRALVIGTDCPELTSEELEQAFGMLDAENEAVIGPAADGGYYLLGLKHFEPELFRGIGWGSDKVLAQTLDRLEHAGMRYGKLAIRHDLDRPEDLDRFPELTTG